MVPNPHVSVLLPQRLRHRGSNKSAASRAFSCLLASARAAAAALLQFANVDCEANES